MVLTNLKKIVLSLTLLSSFEVMGSIPANTQMVNRNLSFRSKNSNSKSTLAMPFYQTAELERKINNKNVLIEVNPRRGKKDNEVAIEMKFYNASGSKAFFKKEVIAKLNQESKITYRGTTVRVTPVLN